MPTNEILRLEISGHIEASETLGKNVSSVRLDKEHFVDSIIDLVNLERMKAKAQLGVKLFHFEAGQKHELEKVLEYLTQVCENQGEDRRLFLHAIINELGENKHKEGR